MPGFLFSNPEIVPEKFRKDFFRHIKTFFTVIGLNIVGGVALNMIMTRVTPKILILPTSIRLPLRLAVMAIPFGATYPKLRNDLQVYDDMLENQFLKIQRLRKTGNIEEYFR
jgi:hypothetical protein